MSTHTPSEKTPAPPTSQQHDFQPSPTPTAPHHDSTAHRLTDEPFLSDPEKSLPRLTPIPSNTSTIDEAIDAEAGLSNEADPRRQGAAADKASGGDDRDPGPPPNGGFKAWLQVAGSFFLFFNCW
jgi:hypothetical protein